MPTVVTTKKLINAVAMTASITSSLYALGKNKTVSAHVRTASTGTPDHVGTVKFQLTNNRDATPPTLGAPVVSISSGATINAIVPDIGVGAATYLRVYYERTSGGTNDTLTVEIDLKE